MGNRALATKEIIKYVEKILPGGGNKEVYEEMLGKLSDKEFSKYMDKLESGDETLFIISPNLSKKRLNVKRNIAIAKELGHSFFEKLWLTDPLTNTVYLTPMPYLVIDLPVRRQAQILNKKVSIPKDNNKVDVTTGQYSGKPIGGKVSFPELQGLYAQGLTTTLQELIKFRGGDEEAFRLMNKELVNTGSVSLSSIKTNTRVKSTDTLSSYLKAMHLNTTL